MRLGAVKTLGWARLGGRKRLELLESERGMVQYNASRFPLATGGDGSMPDRSGPLVSIAIDQRPGWIIDLTESDGSGTVIRPSAPGPAAGPLIDVTPASAVEVDGDPAA
jgi:hypothetical protein